MSKGKKEKVIHVENLIIHAKNVDFKHDKEDGHHHKPEEKLEPVSAEPPRRNSWDTFMWGGAARERRVEENK